MIRGWKQESLTSSHSLESLTDISERLDSFLKYDSTSSFSFILYAILLKNIYETDSK